MFGSVVKSPGSRWRLTSCARRAWPAVTDGYHHPPVPAPTVCPLVIHPAPWAAGCASALAVGRGVGGIYRGCGDGVALRAAVRPRCEVVGRLVELLWRGGADRVGRADDRRHGEWRGARRLV